MSLIIAFALGSFTQDNFADVWQRTRTAIETRYYARAEQKDKMKRLLDEAEPGAKSAKSRAQFAEAVNAMIRKFGDSHFDLLTTDHQGFYAIGTFVGEQRKLRHIGAWFKEVPAGSGRWVVQMVMNGSPAEAAGIRKGDRVVGDFAPVASMDKDRVTLRLQRGEKTLELAADVRESTGMGMFVDGTKASGKVIQQGGKKIAYFRLWTMATDDFRKAINEFASSRLAGTDAMILDLRDGFGGRPEGFLDVFYRPPVVLDWSVGPGMSAKQEFGYGKPLVVLINEGTRSAKEVASLILKKSKRAVLVGKTTAGHVLGTSPMRLADWAILEIPMVRLSVDGESLEGKGVSPDFMVPEEIGSGGEDLILEKGIEVALGQIGKGR